MTFQLKKEQVAAMLKGNKNADAWYDAMIKVFPKYGINTPNRIAGFIAQCTHESNNFTVLEENLNYSAAQLEKVFGKYFSKAGRKASEYAKKPEKIANIVYADRIGNGNTASGDGYKFRGRGIIQLTGRDNYTEFGKTVGKSADDVIAYLGTIEGAVESACWYWNSRNINSACDVNNITQMTKLVNGGSNGLAERKKYYEANLAILGGAVQAIVAIKRGSRGETVKQIQRALNMTADGIFGIGTEITLKSWQAKVGLVPNGIADDKTLKRLLG